MSRIFITGDTHGDYDINKLTSDKFVEGRFLTKQDFLIICGDFGCVWNNDKTDIYWRKWYNEKPWTTLFIDGNHENHYLLDNYPVEKWNDGNIHRISDSIFHLMRGQVFNIDGRIIFTMGGAQSQDKWHRTENIDWWAREMPSDSEYDEAFRNLEKCNNKVNYIISHCTSDNNSDIISNGYYVHDKLTNFLQVVTDTVQFDHMYFGHYHIDKDIDTKNTALYNCVREI